MIRDIVIAIVVAYVLRIMYIDFIQNQSNKLGGSTDSNEAHGLQCPHKRFIRKHLCPNCSSEQDALELSKKRIQFSPTGINGVLFGGEEEYLWEIVPNLLGKKNLCKNKYGLVHFTCNMKTNRCRKKGNHCYTWHHTENGHFFYDKTKC